MSTITVVKTIHCPYEKLVLKRVEAQLQYDPYHGQFPIQMCPCHNKPIKITKLGHIVPMASKAHD